MIEGPGVFPLGGSDVAPFIAVLLSRTARRICRPVPNRSGSGQTGARVLLKGLRLGEATFAVLLSN